MKHPNEEWQAVVQQQRYSDKAVYVKTEMYGVEWNGWFGLDWDGYRAL